MRRYFESPGIDVGFTESFGEAKHLEKDKINRNELLKYKYLLSIEGNDIASGLKWMLLSNSVVFMARPEHESWAMEVRPCEPSNSGRFNLMTGLALRHAFELPLKRKTFILNTNIPLITHIATYPPIFYSTSRSLF